MSNKFRTQFERKRVNSNPGSRFVTKFKPFYDDNGAFELVEDGKIDVYEQIQSFKESTTIQNIIARFQNGDADALNQRLPYFLDVSEMPNSLAGFLQLHANAENYFASLSPDIRRNFNNSASEFFASLGSDDFSERMGIRVHESVSLVDEIEKEVNPE